MKNWIIILGFDPSDNILHTILTESQKNKKAYQLTCNAEKEFSQEKSKISCLKKNQPILDDSFVKVNDKINQFKNSIKEKIKYIKDMNNSLVSDSKSILLHDKSLIEVNNLQNKFENLIINNNSQGVESNCSENDFVIYDSFKKMFNKKKNENESQNQLFQENNLEEKETQNELKKDFIREFSVFKQETSQIYENEGKVFHNNDFQCVNSLEKELDLTDQQNVIQEKSKKNEEKRKTNNKSLYKSKLLFVLKKNRALKNKLLTYKKTISRLKHSNNYLYYKNAFEINKQLSKNFQSSELTNTNVTATSKENHDIINIKLAQKVEDNLQTFELLENEILIRDQRILNQENLIFSQKNTIDNLLEHFKIFYNKENEIMNELINFKQTRFDLNLQNSLKEVEKISNNLNEHNSKINEFKSNLNQVLENNLNLNSSLRKSINSGIGISYNLSKSNLNKELSQDLTAFGIESIVKTSKGQQSQNEEHSLKLTDLISFDLIRSSNKYKFNQKDDELNNI